MKPEPESGQPPETSTTSVANPEPASADVANATSHPPSTYRAKGKIASLPKAQRELINHMLLEGSTYAAVIRKMAEQGVSLNPENVSNWHNGPGYQLWLKDREWLEDMRADQESGLDLLPDFDSGKFNETALQVAVTQLFRAFRHLGSGELKDKLGGD